MMNKKQKDLLISKGYKVLDEINFIKPADIEPNIRIVYDDILKIFATRIMGITLTDDIAEEFMLTLLERTRLVMNLNLLGREDDSDVYFKR